MTDRTETLSIPGLGVVRLRRGWKSKFKSPKLLTVVRVLSTILSN